MNDSRLKSLTENTANVAVGLPIAYFSNLAILPMFDETHAGIALSALWIGLIYTAISYARQYAFRRIFNRLGPNANAYTLFVAAYNKLK